MNKSRSASAPEPGVLTRQLKQHFLEKQYRPGDQIETEMELARSFKVSRAKIREATTALCHLGLLHRRPRAGTRIRRLNPATLGEELAFRFAMAGFDVADVGEARRVVEMAILPLVVRRATPIMLEKLENTLDRMESHLSDPEEADRADRDFHLELLLSCGNETLRVFAGVIAGLFHETIRRQFRMRERCRKALIGHRSLLAAIREENTEKALVILGDHLKDFGASDSSKTHRKP